MMKNTWILSFSHSGQVTCYLFRRFGASLTGFVRLWTQDPLSQPSNAKASVLLTIWSSISYHITQNLGCHCLLFVETHWCLSVNLLAWSSTTTLNWTESHTIHTRLVFFAVGQWTLFDFDVTLTSFLLSSYLAHSGLPSVLSHVALKLVKSFTWIVTESDITS